MKEISQTIQVIAFQLNEKEYGIPISLVRSIENVQTITRVPHTRDFIKGIIHLRGEIIPIVDLRKRFNLPTTYNDAEQKIILVAIADERIGILVDAVKDVLNLSTNSIESPRSILGDSLLNWVNGVVIVESRIITLLQLDSLLLSDMSQHRNEGSSYVLY